MRVLRVSVPLSLHAPAEHVRIGVIEAVLPKYEIAGSRTLARDLVAPPGPESIRGAKEWLGRHMQTPYRPTADQAAFTATVDIPSARRRSASFDKLWRAVSALWRKRIFLLEMTWRVWSNPMTRYRLWYALPRST